MLNNLVSQHLPMQSIQMGQREQISSKLDSSMPTGLVEPGISGTSVQQVPISNMKMGFVGPGSSDAQFQQASITNQGRTFGSFSTNHILQNSLVSNTQIGQMQLQAGNLMHGQFLSPKEQLGRVETMLNNIGSQQLSASNKRKALLEPTLNNSMFQNLSVPNKRAVQMEHRPWLQQVSAPNKLPVHLQPISSTSGLQRLQASSKKAAVKSGPQHLSVHKIQGVQMQPSPKGKYESNESVRSKLRESLATALSLVAQQQDETSSVGKNFKTEVVGTGGRAQENSDLSGCASVTAAAVNHLTREPKESSPISNGITGDSTETSINGGLEFQQSIILCNEDVSFSDNLFVKDELLQGNGLSWVLETDMEVSEKKDIETTKNQEDQKDANADGQGQRIQSPEALASKIEEELFKLFGGVNKKYKEKGRSLLFNLKDRNNPELRERVMSGEIPPDRLCSMTAEELASKELSQWRMAKAEELAQMIVLPDSDVDIRRLVRKTHKGEFQVEVEPQDSVSVEVAVGSSSLTRMQPKSKEKETSPPPKSTKMKDEGNAAGEKSCPEDQDVPCTLTIPSGEGTDLMQGLMVDDELKDAEFLPPIVSLDEFMESLNSEPPFENLPVDDRKKAPTPDKDRSAAGLESKDHSSAGSESKFPGATPKGLIVPTTDKSNDTEVTNTKSGVERKSIHTPVKSESTSVASLSNGERVWEGSIQLNISSTVSVTSIFNSGERTSAKQWPSCIEIKGRVRLDAFEKFLQELPMSRSRAVMVVHFVCKDGSTESESASLCEVADSYVLDGRVGFGEPEPGVELYLCPPHSKTCEMLNKVLQKDQLDALNAIDNGLIGVIVWRKPQITSTISSNKNNPKKQHSISRRHQDKDANMNLNIIPKQSYSRAYPKPQSQPQPQHEDVDDEDDVPPGFGPPANRDEDDLPEFNFSSGSITSRQQFSSKNHALGLGMSPSSQPVDQMRELVHKYGQPKVSAYSNRGVGFGARSWKDDDDDDMPEWNPEDTKYQHLQPIQKYPAQQSMIQPHMLQPTPRQPPAMLLSTADPSWQQGSLMVPQHASHGLPTYHQPTGVHFYGTTGAGSGQQGTIWPRDAPRSGGY